MNAADIHHIGISVIVTVPFALALLLAGRRAAYRRAIADARAADAARPQADRIMDALAAGQRATIAQPPWAR